MHSTFHTRSWTPDAFHTHGIARLGLAPVQGLNSHRGSGATARTAQPSIPTTLDLPAFGLQLVYREEVLPSPDVLGPRERGLICEASGHGPWPLPRGPLGQQTRKEGWTSRTWLGTGRKQGHYPGSVALGQWGRTLGAIKVLTDKKCSPGHAAAGRAPRSTDKPKTFPSEP